MLQQDIDAALQTMEQSLWNEEKGQYDKWVDPWYKNWDGTDRAHPERSHARMTAQLAGPWLTALLDLEPTLDPARIDRAIDGLFEHNCLPVSGCMSNESGTDDANQQSWPYLRRDIFRLDRDHGRQNRHGHGNGGTLRQCHGTKRPPFRLTAGLARPQPRPTQMGPLVHEHPSWYILMALAGVWYDGITHSLTIKPRPWSKMGHLDKVQSFTRCFGRQSAPTKTGGRSRSPNCALIRSISVN